MIWRHVQCRMSFRNHPLNLEPCRECWYVTCARMVCANKQVMLSTSTTTCWYIIYPNVQEAEVLGGPPLSGKLTCETKTLTAGWARLRQILLEKLTRDAMNQQPKTYPHPRNPAARLAFVFLCCYMFFFHLGRPWSRRGRRERKKGEEEREGKSRPVLRKLPLGQGVGMTFGVPNEVSRRPSARQVELNTIASSMGSPIIITTTITMIINLLLLGIIATVISVIISCIITITSITNMI